MNWPFLGTIVIQSVTFILGIYTANKNSSATQSQIDSSTINSMLRIDLKRLINAIEDDVPYDKLKRMAEDIDNDL